MKKVMANSSQKSDMTALMNEYNNISKSKIMQSWVNG